MAKNIVNTTFLFCAILGLNACSNEEQITETNTQKISNVIDTAYLSPDSFIPSETQTNATGQERIEVPLLEQEQKQEILINIEVSEAATQLANQTTEQAIEGAALKTDQNVFTDDSLNQEVTSPQQANLNESSPVDTTIVPVVNPAITSEPKITTDTTSEETKVEPTFSEPVTDVRAPYEKILDELLANYEPIDYVNSKISADEKQKVTAFCRNVSNRLGSVSMKGCLAANHRLSPFSSNNGHPIVITEFGPKDTKKPLGRVLIIGGTHGDELTSISTSYKWIQNLNKFHSGLFHWHIAPSINPDGLLIKPATRTNANGIDINRNLPTPDWSKQSIVRWEKSSKDERKNPGSEAASEAESRWIMHEIATFKPDAIISIHAPYGVLDFDSPELKNAPRKFGRLKLNLLGTYPGSLGNYAGIERQIPVLTLELPNAVAMPPQKELDAIWGDMISWLKGQLK